MNCDEFKKVKDRYLQGDVSPAEENQIEAHLEICPECRGMVDRIVLADEKQSKIPALAKNDTNYIDEKKQQRILRLAKYKNRFSMALFLLALFILLNVAGAFLSSLYFNWGKEEGRLYRVQKTAALITEFTFPNVTMPLNVSPFPVTFSRAGWGHSSIEIKPYFVTRGSYALQKKIGKEEYVIGQLNMNHLFSSILTQWQWQNNSHDVYLYFYHPDQLKSSESNGQVINPIDRSEEIWHALDILSEGTVAEMSVSFSQTYSIDEVKQMLSNYDLEIVWYAVSTGLEANPGHYEESQAPLSAFRGVWGLPDLSHNMLRDYSSISSDDSTLRKEYFLNSMEFLMQNEPTAQKVFRGDPESLQLEKRYEYIKTNGIHVYGVVVTGPVKELLKLKELDMVHSPALGEIRLWNWFYRSFQGEMY